MAERSVEEIRYDALSAVLINKANQIIDVAISAKNGAATREHFGQLDSYAEQIDKWIANRIENDATYVKRYGGTNNYRLILGALQNQLALLNTIKSAISQEKMNFRQRLNVKIEMRTLYNISKKLVQSGTKGFANPRLNTVIFILGCIVIAVVGWIMNSLFGFALPAYVLLGLHAFAWLQKRYEFRPNEKELLKKAKQFQQIILASKLGPLFFRLDEKETKKLPTPGAMSYTFRAWYGEREAAYVIITVSPQSQMGPEPYLAYMNTQKVYRGLGVMGQLVKYVNEYCKKQFQSPLFSGEINKPEAVRVWEKLAKEGLVEGYMFKGMQRWRFFG